PRLPSTLSLHDALPILRLATTPFGDRAAITGTCRSSRASLSVKHVAAGWSSAWRASTLGTTRSSTTSAQTSETANSANLLLPSRSEEHTSELQSRSDLV